MTGSTIGPALGAVVTLDNSVMFQFVLDAYMRSFGAEEPADFEGTVSVRINGDLYVAEIDVVVIDIMIRPFQVVLAIHRPSPPGRQHTERWLVVVTKGKDEEDPWVPEQGYLVTPIDKEIIVGRWALR